MNGFVPWNSQSLSEWSRKHAHGKFVDLNGRSTHYVKRGAGEPLILIHGFNMDVNTWINNIDALAESHKVYGIDLWGLGFSARDSVDPSFELYTEQLLSFMDTLDIQKATLVGHSMGGGTAISFAVRYPERVDRLVLVDSTGIPNPLPLRSKFFTLPGVGEFLMSINNNYFRRKNLRDIWFYEKDRITDQVFDKITQFQKIEGSTEILLEILREDFFHTLSDEISQLNQLDLPILVIWGRHDASIPLEIGEEMHRLLEGSRFEVIENGDHMPNFDNPERFNRIVDDFLLEQQEPARLSIPDRDPGPRQVGQGQPFPAR
ncbi:MAG TPA: alpha/beta fold hydrolase [candidate division Zixibacteria bacterium]|nr:alpha/beta fold hydrolase [candidate division Zixibacteria bacterium]